MLVIQSAPEQPNQFDSTGSTKIARLFDGYCRLHPAE